MAVRTVSVILTADIAAFRRRLGEASRTTTRTTRSMRDDFTRAGRAGARMGRQQAQTLKMVRTAGVGLIAVFGAAVYAASKFEHAMAQVSAVTGASAGQMAQLRAAALEAGRTTTYSASQAAGAQHELAKAGVSVADIAGGALKGALSLAASAELDVAEAAEVAANAMTVFNLRGSDVGHVADVLASAANKSTTDVHQLGMSLRMAGNVAASTGLSIEDTVGSLAMFAAQGMKGSDAGTSLKVMLMRLTPQSAEAAGMMERLGFSAYNSQGRFVGLHEMARRLQESFSGLTPEARNAAMGVIFGADAVRAANIFFKYGEQGVRSYTDAVTDHGYAAAVAARRLDSLVGDLRLLRSTLEVALIQSGTAANAVMRDMVQWVTRLVNIYNMLPPELQSTATLMLGVVGAVGLAGASMLLFLPRVMTVRRELRAMGVTAARTRASLMLMARLGLIIGAFAAVSFGIDKLMDQFRDAPPNVTRLTESLVDLAQKGKASGEAARLFGENLNGVGEAAARIAHPGVTDRIEDFFGALDPITELELDKARKQIKAIDEGLSQLVASGATKEASAAFKRFAAEAEAGGTSTEKFRTLLPKYTDALSAASTEAKVAAGSQGVLGDATETTADALKDQRTEAEKLNDALAALNGGAISAAEAQINFQSSLDDLTGAVKENGRGLDVTGEKGRAVKQAFLDAAKAAQEHAGAIAEQTHSQAKGRAALEQDIAALRRTMLQAGYTDAQINKLIGTFAKLPPKTEAEVRADTAAALVDLETVQAKLRETKGKSVTVDALTDDARKALENLGFKIKATKGKKLTITAPTSGAKASVDALARAIQSLKDRKITITTNKVQVVTEVQRKVSEYYTPGKSANGNIYGKAFAGGGMERHVAQIAQPTYRLWAEPETGGEAYIPLAAAKRGRSTAILAQVAEEFGYRLERYASGGKTKKKTPQSVINARRELPSDFADFSRSLSKSASEIKSAAKAMATDLKKLGNAGWRLAGQVDKTSRKLQSMAAQRDRIRARIDTAREFASTQTGQTKDFLALGEGQTAYDLAEELRKKIALASKFRGDIRRLEKRGIHKDLLAQVIEEGPEGELAKKLLAATPGQFKELNRLAGKGSKLATYIGQTSADAMYDVGKYTANGFLGGLKSQEKALQKQMDKLGKSLVDAIKKALKIKSPSQVMRDEIGKQVGRGLVQGMDRSMPAVAAAAARYEGVISGRKFVSRLPAPAKGQSRPVVQVHARVFVGDRELTDIVRTEVDCEFGRLDAALTGGRVVA